LAKLEIFYHVARLRSFSEAAEELRLQQPTVSAHIRTLEGQVGGRLFDRLGRELALTPLGRLLYTQAEKLLALREETQTVVERFHGRVSGRLRVGGSTIPGEYLLPSYLSRFKKAHPEVWLILEIGDSQKIISAVEAGELEVGVVGARTAADADKLDFQELWHDHLILVVSTTHPWARRACVSLKEIFQENFITREPGSGTRESLYRFLREKGHDPDRLCVHLELGSTEAVKQALVAGLGVSILSETAVRCELQMAVLKEVRVRGFRPTRTFYLVRPRRRTLSPAAQAFCNFIQKG
jgi:DNA-binding transcriptional LysR family regulator